jgi:DNA topoisomerase-3
MNFKLVIAEKPSVAKSIAAVLGANKREDGAFSGGGYIVSWCYGHLVEFADADAYDSRYAKWRLADLPIIPDKWKYKTSKNAAKQIKVLRELMKRPDVDTIICATDAGREGELIFRLVYDYCSCHKPVKRWWVSSMEESAIRKGFASLKDSVEYDNLYHSALCRAQADFLVGINATRLYTCLYNGGLLNVGRVQSPTLAMLVNREAAIDAFVSEPFYVPEIDCGVYSASGEKFADFDAAESVRTAADGCDASVLSVEKTRKTTTPPKLYDLTTLQRDANRLLGFTAQQTLDYAQSAYEKRLMSYPRTDSQYLTDDMSDTATAVVTALFGSVRFAGGISYKPDISRIIDSGKVSDHHALLPTLEYCKSDWSALPTGEREILSLVTLRLLCAVAPVHSYEAVTAILDCGGYQFTAKGSTVLVDGWKAIDSAYKATLRNKPDEDADDKKTLPELSEGQVFPTVTASIREGKSEAPRRFTEDTLLHALETANLGTPATRAGIIEKIVKSGFVERQKKHLVPTDKGKNLIAVLPEEIKSPELTAEWEQKLKLIERGELSSAEFMSGIADLTKGLVAAHNAPNPECALLFASPQKGEIVGNCPRCGANVTDSGKAFFCSNRACKFALWKDSRFWTAKGKTLDSTIAATLLSEGRVSFSDLKSERTGKTYAATIVLDDNGKKVNYKMEFLNRS